MYETFDDVVNRANNGMRSAIRAQQAWQLLIAKASNRQISTYVELLVKSAQWGARRSA